METTFIYALADPRDGAIRYVGKSNAPKYRYSYHVRARLKSHRCSWILGLQAVGLKPTLLILEEVPRDQWQEYERAWIKRLREEGCNLTNLTEGGACGTFTPESLEKSRVARLGKPGHLLGKRFPEEWRRSQSESAKRRWDNMTDAERFAATDHLRQGGNRAHRGIPPRVGWRHSDETCQKIREKSLGRTHSEESRRKMSAAVKKAFAEKPPPGAAPETLAKMWLVRRRLSVEQVEQIRLLLASGKVSARAIAAQMGVSESVISKIKHGKSYPTHQ